LRLSKNTPQVSAPYPHFAPPSFAPGASMLPTPGKAPESSVASAKTAAGVAIPSPLVGTAYLAPKPDAQPFIKVGDTVQEGQTLLIIEAMKVMNPIAAPSGGTVLEICVANGAPVEFDQTLVRLG